MIKSNKSNNNLNKKQAIIHSKIKFKRVKGTLGKVASTKIYSKTTAISMIQKFKISKLKIDLIIDIYGYKSLIFTHSLALKLILI